MSKKEVEASKVRFVPAKKPTPPRAKTTFLDGIKVSSEAKVNLPVETHYKDSGKTTEDINGSFAMMKKYPDGTTDYFVKQATSGSGSGRLLNPWGLYFNPGDEDKFEKQLGRKKYVFKKVSKEVFDLYLKFLTTRNEKNLLIAERNILDQT